MGITHCSAGNANVSFCLGANKIHMLILSKFIINSQPQGLCFNNPFKIRVTNFNFWY